MENVEIIIPENISVQYTIIPTEWKKYRHIQIGENVKFTGKWVLVQNTDLTIISDIVWDQAESHLEILSIAKANSNISVEGIARVEKPYRKVFTRVDQTNILIGENTFVRGVPRLEIATDDVEGGHSCKIHRLHGDALFYLESHGLDAEHAESFLLNSEILRHLDTLPDDAREEKCLGIHAILFRK